MDKTNTIAFPGRDFQAEDRVIREFEKKLHEITDEALESGVEPCALLGVLGLTTFRVQQTLYEIADEDAGT